MTGNRFDTESRRPLNLRWLPSDTTICFYCRVARYIDISAVLRSFISCALLYGLARNWDCVVVVVASSITSMSADDLVVVALRFCSILLMAVVWLYPSNMMVVFDL